MAKEILTFRIQKSLLERADALIPRLKDDESIDFMDKDEISRSSVLRMAVNLGLDVLEARYQGK